MILLQCRKCGHPATAGIYLNSYMVSVCCWKCAADCNEEIIDKAKNSTKNFNVIQLKELDDK